MRKSMGSLVLAALMVMAFMVFVPVANATHSNGQGPDKDFTNGTGKQTGVFISPFGIFALVKTHINAQANGPAGSDAQGHFNTLLVAGAPNLFPPGTEETLSGDIRCLDAQATANGTESIDRGVVTESTGPVVLVGAGTIGKRIDRGEPGSDATPDESGGNLAPALPPNPPPGSCPPGGTPFATAPNAQGNYVVHDGI